MDAHAFKFPLKTTNLGDGISISLLDETIDLAVKHRLLVKVNTKLTQVGPKRNIVFA